jgi:signal transduction histidine kinase
VQGIVRDITVRKRTEEELRRTTEELEFLILERTTDLVKTNEALEKEIAERKEIERHITATNDLLKLFSQTFLRREYLDALVELLRTWCRCDGVGIRLVDEYGNIPYGSYAGFSREFWEEESCLSTRKDQCLCPRIVSEKPDPQESPYMTPKGSFFCNDMECFIAAMTKEERARYRGACAAHGVASLATIPVRYREKVLGAIHLVDKGKDNVQLKLIQFIESLSPLIGEALYRFYIEEALMSSREQLRNLSMHLQAAIEEERTKIAREIHDELGQTLTAASMELSRIKAKKTSQKSVSALVLSASELIDSAVQDIQRICSELRPRVLDHLGLLAAIEWQAKKFSERSGIRCTLDIGTSPANLPDTMSTALFRIFQETLTNVARHAKATEVTVHMGVIDNTLVLEVKDNGKGIGKQKIFGKNSFGIMGIRERVHDFGGSVVIKSVMNKGTTVTVEVPLNKGGE